MSDPASADHTPVETQHADLPAQIEVLDRDGHLQQTLTVRHWPLRVGRALDNDLVLNDPHVAAHHLNLAPGEAGLMLHAGDTRNGVQLGRKRLRSGESAPLPVAGDAGDAGEIGLGRTRLRLRLPAHALAPELALAATASLPRRIAPIALTAALVLAGLLFQTWLDTDPEGLARAAGGTLLNALIASATWCGAWALLSKTFTRQARFGWHLQVLLFAGVALLAVTALAGLGAFAFSWPWLTDFAFVGEIGVIATALYFHLLAVEPARRRTLKGAALTCALVGIGLTLWFNVQRSDLFGDELYMNHLFPPALRLAKPVSTGAFIDGLTSLKPALDKKAREPGIGDEGGREED